MGRINGIAGPWECNVKDCHNIVKPRMGVYCEGHGGRVGSTETHTNPDCLKPQVVDVVNHPPHYTSHPSGVECITVTEHMGFNLGNALKYIWRSDLKGKAIEDLKKAMWYIEREIAKRKSTDAE